MVDAGYTYRSYVFPANDVSFASSADTLPLSCRIEEGKASHGGHGGHGGGLRLVAEHWAGVLGWGQPFTYDV
jgi:hypothetical protein